VIALPRHLAAWAPQLALFPEEIALALGPLVTRLSQLIGAARIDHGREGTPDGYDGITTRGSYDRLLASEWLIHDELPDEFLRRVVSGEHAFLRRMHRHEAAARRTIALFDSGIDQLGAPRLAHLAALIVLAQRADRARASLAWGLLQDRSGTLRASVTEDTVRGLLDSYCAANVADGDIAHWLASDDVAGASEIWLIGPERLAEEPRPHQASVLAVSDVLEPHPLPRIKVTVSGSQGLRPRTATLDVPEERAAVQLLRDPFGRAVASRLRLPSRVDAGAGMVFSGDGRKLYLRAANGCLLTVRIPNSPRATVGPPIASRPLGAPIIAVGSSRLNKRTVVICRKGDEAIIHLLHRRGRTVSATDRFGGMTPETDDGLLRPLGILGGPHRPDGPALQTGHLCFIDANGRFVEITSGRLGIKSGPPIVASRASRDAFIYIERSLFAKVWVARAGKNGELEHTRAGIDLPGLTDSARYYFGEGGLANLVAYWPSASRCAIVHRLQTETFDVPSGHTVFGMVELRTAERGYAGLKPVAAAIDSSRTGIELLRPGECRQLLTTTTPIAFAAASDAAPVIAFITRSGELGIYSCAANAMVLRVATEMTA
jgi:hypothetical protein